MSFDFIKTKIPEMPSQPIPLQTALHVPQSRERRAAPYSLLFFKHHPFKDGESLINRQHRHGLPEVLVCCFVRG